VLGAVYLNEYGGNRILAQLISFMSNVMTGVPSIVMGLFIFIIWVSTSVTRAWRLVRPGLPDAADCDPLSYEMLRWCRTASGRAATP